MLRSEISLKCAAACPNYIHAGLMHGAASGKGLPVETKSRAESEKKSGPVEFGKMQSGCDPNPMAIRGS
jgi:hypothetical protein